MPSIIQSRYDQGREAYHDGHGIRHVVEVLDQIERHRDELLNSSGSPMSEPDPVKRDEIQAQREAIHTGTFGRDAGPSVIAGFADGLIADIRLLANQRRGQTA